MGKVKVDAITTTMADDKGKTFEELDKEAIEKFNRRLKHEQQREAKMHQQWYWRGNKLPPFNIEPQPFTRQRLAGSGMTPEQPAARKQWVMDQKLAPNEPRYVPELYPKNIVRRAWAAPWNAMYYGLKSVVGPRQAMYARMVIPKALAGLVIAWGMWYNVKYTPSTWEAKQGWHIYSTKDRILPGDSTWPNPPEKAYDDFHDKGFK